MFQQLKNIDSAFSYLRVFTFVLVCCCTALSCYAIYYSFSVVEKAGERVYILKNGAAFSATASTRTENIPAEGKHHVQMFHQLFFNLSPDEIAINTTISKAFYLADRSASEVYDDLKEKGYYSGVISGNVSQYVHMDSLTVDTRQYPYYFKFYGQLRIVRTSAIITRSLITEGYMRELDRTDNNPHGFLIEKWRILENADIKYQTR